MAALSLLAPIPARQCRRLSLPCATRVERPLGGIYGRRRQRQAVPAVGLTPADSEGRVSSFEPPSPPGAIVWALVVGPDERQGRSSAVSGSSIAETNEQARYCVRTATEVSPRSTPLASVKVTKTRLTPGESATAALPVTKMPKVGVALGWMSVVTLEPGAARQAPLWGLVWHTVSVTGRLAVPALALAVIIASIPRLTAATANTPVPVAPGIST